MQLVPKKTTKNEFCSALIDLVFRVIVLFLTEKQFTFVFLFADFYRFSAPPIGTLPKGNFSTFPQSFDDGHYSSPYGFCGKH
jgi:hypothetical protein